MTEEKIKKEAEKLMNTLPCDEPKGLVCNAFKYAAKWAIENQWSDANKELPTDNEDVILYAEGLYLHCRYVDKRFVIMDGFPVGEDTNGKLLYSSSTYDPNLVIDYWMPTPKLSIKEETKW